jgi:uncharacterized protein YabE (DUF348 family)
VTKQICCHILVLVARGSASQAKMMDLSSACYGTRMTIATNASRSSDVSVHRVWLLAAQVLVSCRIKV